VVRFVCVAGRLLEVGMRVAVSVDEDSKACIQSAIYTRDQPNPQHAWLPWLDDGDAHTFTRSHDP
jgi:hypothetical protein